jgi:hypothetical protein
MTYQMYNFILMTFAFFPFQIKTNTDSFQDVKHKRADKKMNTQGDYIIPLIEGENNKYNSHSHKK